MRLKQATVEGKVVKVGGFVGFKTDSEYAGEVVEIYMNDWGREVLIIWNPDGFVGGMGYHGNTTMEVPAENCWIFAGY